MLAYYVGPGLAIEVAETPAACERLEARGYTRCTSAYHKALWEIRDRKRGRELRQTARERTVSVTVTGERYQYSGILANEWRGKP